MLIDFWATLYGPCITEIPNMLKNWEKHYDKGVEIVGVTVYDKVGAVEQFVEKRKLLGQPLTTNKGFKQAWIYWPNYYGIWSMPTMILIGRDGKVISTEARSETLNKELKKFFRKKFSAFAEKSSVVISLHSIPTFVLLYCYYPQKPE